MELSTLYSQAYSKTVTVSNNLGATVDASIRCGSSERYTVEPASISLKPGHSCSVEVCLRVLKYAQKKKAAEQGQRDVFHIKVGAYLSHEPIVRLASLFLCPEPPRLTDVLSKLHILLYSLAYWHHETGS